VCLPVQVHCAAAPALPTSVASFNQHAREGEGWGEVWLPSAPCTPPFGAIHGGDDCLPQKESRWIQNIRPRPVSLQ
jgi:hypothetical protein